MRRALLPVLCVVAVVAALLPGCRREDGSARGIERVRRVGERDLTDAEFRRYVLREIGVSVEGLDPAAVDRLWGEFLGEVLLARAAEREGIVPDPDAVDRELARLRELGAGGDREELLREARRRVLAGTYVERILAPRVTVTPEEVEAALPPAEGSRTRHYVVFRQIRVEDEAAARQAWRRVTRGREPFDEVAREVSTAPDRGRLQQRDLAVLPGPVAEALRRLPVGGVSRPVPFDRAYYLFELEARNRDPDPGRARERREIEDRIFREKLDRLREATLERLAREEGIRLPRAAAAAEEER